jgi:hypothetical protein
MGNCRACNPDELRVPERMLRLGHVAAQYMSKDVEHEGKKIEALLSADRSGS